MDMGIIQNAANELLLNVSLAVISLVGGYAVYYIRLGAEKVRAQTTQIADEAGRKLLENALNDVAALATLSVGAMEQTTAKALRDSVRDGKADKEELVALSRQVFDEVKSSIGKEAQRVITLNLGSFVSYLTKYIEDAVLRVKHEDPYITLPSELLASER